MRVIPVVLCCLALAACGTTPPAGDSGQAGSISSDSTKVTLGVNAYLWHASLGTLAFMPLASADPFGGVIITNWYSAPETPNERVKVTVYILSRTLRADGLKVAVFRQTNTGGVWSDAAVNQDTAVKLEDAILTRARELRLSSETTGK